MEDYSKGQMIAIGILFAVMPIFAVSIRLWAKAMSPKDIRLDDHLIMGALVTGSSTILEPIANPARCLQSPVASYSL